MRDNTVAFELIQLLPADLRQGVVYVSFEHETMVHLCCCGCGARVVTDIGPSGWDVSIDDDAISIAPSIGTGAQACGSHYWIRGGKVHWAPSMTAAQIKAAQLRDRREAAAHFEGIPRSYWRRLIDRIRRRLKRRRR